MLPNGVVKLLLFMQNCSFLNLSNQQRRATPISVKPEEPLDEYVSPPKMKREMFSRITPPSSGTERIKPPPVLAPAPVSIGNQ